MAILTCGFEGGTLGGTIGTDGGDASVAFASVSGTSWTYSSAQVNRGTRSALLASAASGTHRLSWANGTSAALLRAYVRISSSPTTDTWLLASNPSGTNGIRAILQGTGRLRLTDNGGTILWTATNTFPTAQWVRVELYATAGTSTTTGSARVAYYLGNSTTPVDDSTLLTGINTAAAAAAFEQARFGGAGSAGDVWYDDIGAKTGADAAWGAWVAANQPPVVTLTANQNVSAGATVNVAATASDADGSVASYAWSVVQPSTATPTLTGASTDAISFTAPAAGNLVTLQCVVTDNDGATTTVTTEVRVPLATGTTIAHLSVAGSGATWTNTGGASTDGAALNDASDTTYLASPALTGSATARRVRLQPSAPRSSLTLTERLRLGAAGASTVTVRLIEGASTVRQSWTLSPALSTTAANYELVVSSPGAISDWGYLSVEVSGTT